MKISTNSRQAIVTKFHGMTNTKPQRVSATTSAMRLYHIWDSECSIEENHALAAERLIKELGWDKFNPRWAMGTLPDGNTRVFVSVEAEL